MTFRCIAPQAAKELLDERAPQVFDIRDPASFNQAHVDGAINLNNNNVDDVIRNADPDAPTLVFCYHGHSSQGAADFLVRQGFTEVYSVDGGMEHWRGVYPVING